MAFHALQGPFDYVYLSPHFDDVAFSCGGQIAQRTKAGASVLIVTAMAGQPPAKRLSNLAIALHAKWGLGASAVSVRKSEDEASCSILGAQALRWPVLDCIYREGSIEADWLYSTSADLFGPIDPQEEVKLVTAVARLIEGLPEHRALVAPLAVGHHVDHQVVRRAAEAIGGNVSFYEDFPYAFGEAAVAAALGTESDWLLEQIDLSVESRRKKSDALEAHKSQIGNYPQMRVPGGFPFERLWRRR